ncbi:hypothetical protein BOTBODRAFT_177766 [Botryobasidium botryosum FD-172 SS1]|uniref:DUF7726 domain-containing protein n=1 Tax=Botryobasidium botryosum (strain FD-172 SS1) TaxID=930990 RepID=A0A067M5S2_BOTB1|nr:hypothetical protein BOTBODRAFT_177766 [Botryobasidium botryosum FD-172 SS1]
MPPKRKSTGQPAKGVEKIVVLSSDAEADTPKPAKRARVVKVTKEPEPVASGSKTTKARTKATAEPKKDWSEIALPGENEGRVRIYDDCNDIRRKIRALQRTPGFKVTHWLREIGDINNNSYQRFMRGTGATAGAENGTYVAAYKYFEKVRIAEGKKKSVKRLRMEKEHPMGLELQDLRRTGFWDFAPPRAHRRY